MRKIEVQSDFLVTYDCHTDTYVVDGKEFQGWKTFANYTRAGIHRKKIRENKREGKVTWALRKTTKQTCSISWTLKIPPNSSNKLFIFVNSASIGEGQVRWFFSMPGKMNCQLTSRVVNCIQLNDSTDELEGSGKTKSL